MSSMQEIAALDWAKQNTLELLTLFINIVVIITALSTRSSLGDVEGLSDEYQERVDAARELLLGITAASTFQTVILGIKLGMSFTKRNSKSDDEPKKSIIPSTLSSMVALGSVASLIQGIVSLTKLEMIDDITGARVGVWIIIICSIIGVITMGISIPRGKMQSKQREIQRKFSEISGRTFGEIRDTRDSPDDDDYYYYSDEMEWDN